MNAIFGRFIAVNKSDDTKQTANLVDSRLDSQYTSV